MCIADESIGNIAKKTKVSPHDIPKQIVIPALRIYVSINKKTEEKNEIAINVKKNIENSLFLVEFQRSQQKEPELRRKLPKRSLPKKRPLAPN